MSDALIARSMARDPRPSGRKRLGEGHLPDDGESVMLERWRSGRRRFGQAYAEPPESLKRARVDKELPLEAEVVRRQRGQEVAINIHIVAALRPDARARWLTMAFESVEAGSARPSDVYDVVVHPRFGAGVSSKLAQLMMHELLNHL
mmetsp:Transcript_95389/g.269719  ORF Transcript_95389/g.269719 Transcript_95389/m.269719 type:complete len:147 (+) Transcript_95389:64-504(+)